MSTAQDVERFLAFLHDAFVARVDSAYASSNENDHDHDEEVDNEEPAEHGTVDHLNTAAAAVATEEVLPATA